MNLAGRVAVVTGAGAGLGRAHAMMLARYGAKVVINDLANTRDNTSIAEAVVGEITAAGGEAFAVEASVTDEAQVAAMIARAMEKWGRVDILVNNAGILRDKTFAKMSLDDFRAVVEVHLMGAVICTRAVWEIMRAQTYGRIVMTTSSSGLFGNFGQANYGAAKMALVGLMQTLAIEGAKTGIRVNCLAPTAATAMLEDILPEDMQRLLRPEHVSPGLLSLVSEDAPTRAILTAGAGHFACAYITLTKGGWVGSARDAADSVIAQWEKITAREGEIVPSQGRVQVEHELASAGYQPKDAV